MNEIFDNCENVDEVVLLGDVKHDFGKITKQEWQKLYNEIARQKKKVIKILGFGNKERAEEEIKKSLV